MGEGCAVLIPAHGGKLQLKQVLTTMPTIVTTGVDAGTSNGNRKYTVPVTAPPVLDMRGDDRHRRIVRPCRPEPIGDHGPVDAGRQNVGG